MEASTAASREEVGGPTPLVFHIPQKKQCDDGSCGGKDKKEDSSSSSLLTIKLHQMDETQEQTQAADHNTGFVMWPSAVMLSRYIAKNPPLALQATDQYGLKVGSGDVLELGAGCGLVGLTAATMLQQIQAKQTIASMASASAIGEIHGTENEQEGRSTQTTKNKVIFTDYNADVLVNLTRNATLNDLEGHTAVAGLDFFDQEQDEDNNLPPYWIDMEGNRRPQVSLILATDILCYSNDAELVANTIQAALVEGGHAIIMGPNSNHRFGIEEFPEACRKLGLTIEVTDHIMAMDKSDNNYTSYSPNNSTTGSGGDNGSDNDDTDDNNDGGTNNTKDAAKLLHDLDSKTTGYNNYIQRGYGFTMFTIDKPIVTTTTTRATTTATTVVPLVPPVH